MDGEPRIILTINVPSVEGTAAWYERVLGWRGHFDTFDEQGRCVFGSVMMSKDPFVGFNLSRSEQFDEEEPPCRHGSNWVYVQDVDAIYNRVLRQGWPIESEIANQFWGERQFRIRDLNGNELVFVQPIEDLDLEQIRARHRALLAKS